MPKLLSSLVLYVQREGRWEGGGREVGGRWEGGGREVGGRYEGVGK